MRPVRSGANVSLLLIMRVLFELINMSNLVLETPRNSENIKRNVYDHMPKCLGKNRTMICLGGP